MYARVVVYAVALDQKVPALEAPVHPAADHQPGASRAEDVAVLDGGACAVQLHAGCAGVGDCAVGESDVLDALGRYGRAAGVLDPQPAHRDKLRVVHHDDAPGDRDEGVVAGGARPREVCQEPAARIDEVLLPQRAGKGQQGAGGGNTRPHCTALTLAASSSEIRFIAIHRARLSAFDAELMSDGWSEMSRWLGSTVKFVKYS